MELIRLCIPTLNAARVLLYVAENRDRSTTAEEIVISDFFPSEMAEDPDEGLSDLEGDPDLARYYRDLAEIDHTIHTAP